MSILLTEKLLAKNLIIVATFRKNKPEISIIMQPSKTKKRHSSEFGLKNNMTMVSYVGLLKKGQVVILLCIMSTMTKVSMMDQIIEIISHCNQGRARKKIERGQILLLLM